MINNSTKSTERLRSSSTGTRGMVEGAQRRGNEKLQINGHNSIKDDWAKSRTRDENVRDRTEQSKTRESDTKLREISFRPPSGIFLPKTRWQYMLNLNQKEIGKVDDQERGQGFERYTRVARFRGLQARVQLFAFPLRLLELALFAVLVASTAFGLDMGLVWGIKVCLHDRALSRHDQLMLNRHVPWLE